MFDDEKPATKGKSKSAKGAPKPRKTRGRTINRRRSRFVRKMALKLAKIEALDLDPVAKAQAIATIREAIKLSQDAQVRHAPKK